MKELEKNIRNQIKVLYLIVLFLFSIVISLGVGLYIKSDANFITTQGIIIQDEKGNDRILIGAPIPASKDRLREDLLKVEATYGKDFPNEIGFMDIYKNKIKNKTNGIVLLDANGFDRVVLGDPVPDPYFGTRIGPSTGLIINDSIGLERTGYGLLELSDGYRVSLGFDTRRGIEGMGLCLDDNGTTYFNIGKDIVLGDFPKSHYYSGGKTFKGIRISQNDTLKMKINAIDN